jgi:DNA-binding response OmpR family regulator
MVAALTQAGCDVEAACTGEKAMKIASQNRFDLITLDIELPDITGFEICSELKQRHISRNTPIVFVSGKCSLEDQQRGLDAGAVDYITKPFGMELVPRLLSHIPEEKGISH